MWRSAAKDNLRPSEKGISGLNHTPHATAVYASCSALLPPHATLASRRLAGPYLSFWGELSLLDPCVELGVEFVEGALERGIDGAQGWKSGGQTRAQDFDCRCA